MYKSEDVTEDVLNGIKLLPHQIAAVRSCCDHEISTIVSPTGSGKTECICSIAMLLKCPTIIIAEEKVVIDQIKERLELRGVVDEAGLFYAGKSPTGQLVCVGSLASLMPPSKIVRRHNESVESYERKVRSYKTRFANFKKYKELIGRCELLMVDEADRAVNQQYKKLILRYTNSRYLYGFTATLPDPKEDRLNWINMNELLGSVVFRAGREELEAIGRIIPIRYITTVIGKPDKFNRDAFDIAVDKWINKNDDLHNKVAKIVKSFPNDNFMILVENIALGQKLESIIPNSSFIYGDTRAKKRDDIIDKFEKKTLRVLIGSKILKRGLDLAGGVDNLIVCASSRKNAEIEQKIGRAVRLNKRGWSRVFDFLFVGNAYLYMHSRKRLKRICQIGYPSMVIAGNTQLDGYKVIKPGFNLFKHLKQ
jgi:superfamily II DNA or RNA helicase